MLTAQHFCSNRMHGLVHALRHAPSVPQAVIHLTPATQVLHSFGGDTFFMPHMISVDLDGNIWVTDVGLHQAIKFSPAGEKLMELGERLVHGNNGTHLCKPTKVRGHCMLTLTVRL